MLTTLVFAGPATANHPEASLAGSNFEIDENANLKVDDASPSIDWGGLAHPNGPELRATDLATGQNDNSYKGGTKEDTVCPNQTTGSIPNNKSDLLTFHVYEEPGDPGFLNLAWSRVSDPSGTTLMDFEFNQSSTNCPQGPNRLRTAGDLLIEYAIDQGGSRADITGRFWTGTAWGAPIDLDTGTACNGGPCAVGTINQTAIPAGEADGLGAKGQFTFGEAQINLDLIFDDESCVSFGSAMLKSRSSDSFTSQLKDFIAPIDIDLQNCGSVTIRKVTDPSPDPTASSFDFTSDVATDPANDLPANFSLADGESESSDLVLAGGPYTVTEADPSGIGFDLTDIDCTVSGGASAVENVDAGTVTITMTAEGSVDCTYTNTARGNIIVKKETDPDGSAQLFTFSTDYGADFQLADGQMNDSGDLAPGTYSVSETVPDGWELKSVSCDDGSDASSISLQAGETVTCTFNNEQDANIVVKKETDPDGSPQLFTFSTDYGADFQLADGQMNDSGDLDPGTYSVSETVPDGWELKSASCDDGSDPSSIGLSAGETVTCTFNNEQDANIVVEKQTDPDGSTQLFTFSPSYGADFQLTDGQTNDSGDLDPGTYSVSETVPDGWALDSATCDNGDDPSSIDLLAGETVTCTFNNSIGAIQIGKTTKNATLGTQPLAGATFEIRDAGDNLVATAVTGSDGSACVDGLIVGDTYTVTETAAPAGYDPSAVAPQDIVAAAAECDGAGTPAPANFVNDPLSKITIEFESLAGDGVTLATSVVCTGPGGFDSGELGTLGDDSNPESVSITNLVEGEYICTIFVDP